MNRQHDTTAPRDSATALAAIRQTCPVAALTERLASARAAYRDADTRRMKGRHTGPEANRADRECRHRLAEECAVQAMIACSRAVSLEGAAVQIAEIVPNLEVLWDALSDRPDADQTEAYLAAFRLIYSALGAVERHLTVPLAQLVDAQFGERGLDPWRSHEEGATDHAAPQAPAMPDFKQAFLDLDDLISAVRRPVLTLDFLIGTSDERRKSFSEGRLIGAEELDAFYDTSFNAREAVKTLEDRWCETHAALCAFEHHLTNGYRNIPEVVPQSDPLDREAA